MRIRSVRVRIALWNTAVFAVFLAALGMASQWFLAHTSLERVDEFLAESAGAIASAIEFERSAGAPDTVAIRSVLLSMQLPDVVVQVFDRRSGDALSSQDGLRFRRPDQRAKDSTLADSLAQAARAVPTAPTLRTFTAGNEEVRGLAVPHRVGQHELVLAVAQVMTARSAMLREGRMALLLGFPLVLGFASLGGYWLAGKSLAPVATMSTRARAIGASSLHERLPVVNPGDELGRLATAFNDLLSRLERAFETQARFVADASHELRTPVSVISGESELALERERPREELIAALRIIENESDRLRMIVDDLFLLARADSGERVPRLSLLHLRDLVEDSGLSVRSLAGQEGVTLRVVASDAAPIQGDEALLRRAIDNLVVNAIKYSGREGKVEVQLRDAGNEWHIDVHDSGRGIAPEARDRIFERFFRTDEARATRRSEGAGLGLPIARWVARAHGGDVYLVASSDAGSTFRIGLPKQAQTPPPNAPARDPAAFA